MYFKDLLLMESQSLASFFKSESKMSGLILAGSPLAPVPPPPTTFTVRTSLHSADHFLLFSAPLYVHLTPRDQEAKTPRDQQRTVLLLTTYQLGHNRPHLHPPGPIDVANLGPIPTADYI